MLLQCESICVAPEAPAQGSARRARPFVEEWRRRKCRAFDVERNSTAGRAVQVGLWGRPFRIYANANLSIYSAQSCNGDCPFCVEKLRPASRGRDLAVEKGIEADDGVYFAALDAVLRELRPLDPSVSVTGGEPSLDPRLPRILRLLDRRNMRKRTITTNGSGLLHEHEGRALIDRITSARVRHLNISRAHPDADENARLMRLPEPLGDDHLREVVRRAGAGGTRVRLSCVLLDGVTDCLEKMIDYLAFAQGMGVDNVVFRQLMQPDAAHAARSEVARYNERFRVALELILDRVSRDDRFAFVRQVVGYYYYVEVWRYRAAAAPPQSGAVREIDVVFEEADLGQLEATKRTMPGVIHDLVFHPDAHLGSTWQPWDPPLGPPRCS